VDERDRVRSKAKLRMGQFERTRTCSPLRKCVRHTGVHRRYLSN